MSNFRKAMWMLAHEYYGSEDWKRVRLKVKKRANSKCNDCHKKAENGTAHHISYDNWGKANFEEIKDCVWLCKKDHNKRHLKHQDGEVPFWVERNATLEVVQWEELEDAVNQI